jgi:hypothetical protein
VTTTQLLLGDHRNSMEGENWKVVGTLQPQHYSSSKVGTCWDVTTMQVVLIAIGFQWSNKLQSCRVFPLHWWNGSNSLSCNREGQWRPSQMYIVGSIWVSMQNDQFISIWDGGGRLLARVDHAANLAQNACDSYAGTYCCTISSLHGIDGGAHIWSGGHRWLCMLLLHWNPMVISNKMQSCHGPPYQHQQPQKWIDSIRSNRSCNL